MGYLSYVMNILIDFPFQTTTIFLTPLQSNTDMKRKQFADYIF